MCVCVFGFRRPKSTSDIWVPQSLELFRRHCCEMIPFRYMTYTVIHIRQNLAHRELGGHLYCIRLLPMGIRSTSSLMHNSTGPASSSFWILACAPSSWSKIRTPNYRFKPSRTYLRPYHTSRHLSSTPSIRPSPRGQELTYCWGPGRGHSWLYDIWFSMLQLGSRVLGIRDGNNKTAQMKRG